VNRSTLFVLATTATLLLPAPVSAQAKRYPLESVGGLRFHNVNAEPAVLKGKKGLRATISEETLRRIERTQLYARGLVWIEDLDFSNGVIEAEIAGALAPGAGAEARGFVGIAFRVQEDLETYDAFYLRPTNGRAGEQERRNHSAQYITAVQIGRASLLTVVDFLRKLASLLSKIRPLKSAPPGPAEGVPAAW
jgi:hypothetical protein